MCGVFGFVARGDERVDLATLERIASTNERRGQDAWGVAWVTHDGRMGMYKDQGPISAGLNLLPMVRDAKLIIGHTRLATQGAPDDNANNHPHPVDGGWLVHNGMIPHYQSLVRDHGLHPSTDCDSEVIGLLVESLTEGDILDRCVRAANVIDTRLYVMLGLWKSGQMVAVRRGHPLHSGVTRRGRYLSSVPDAVPNAVEMRDNYGVILGATAKARPLTTTKPNLCRVR